MIDERLKQAITGAVGKIPEWLRQDLSTKDASVRQRAEETLAAIIISRSTRREAHRLAGLTDLGGGPIAAGFRR